MRKIIVLAAILGASPALAQQGPQVSPMAYVNALAAQRNAAQDAAALAQAQVADMQAKFDALQKDYDALKTKEAAPPSEPPAPK